MTCPQCNATGEHIFFSPDNLLDATCIKCHHSFTLGMDIMVDDFSHATLTLTLDAVKEAVTKLDRKEQAALYEFMHNAYSWCRIGR